MALENAGGGGAQITTDELMEVAREKNPRDRLVVVRVNEVLPPKDITVRATGKVRSVKPVDVDFLFVSGPRANEVFRGVELIGAGIVGSLRRKRPGTDVMGRLDVMEGERPYPGLQPCEPDEAAIIEKLFDATKNDPYSAAEAIVAADEPADDDAPF